MMSCASCTASSADSDTEVAVAPGGTHSLIQCSDCACTPQGEYNFKPGHGGGWVGGWVWGGGRAMHATW
jgi:hypothetical protein